MTLNDLAMALRGMPRNARMLIDTPDGLKDLRWVKPVHALQQQDRELQADTTGEYAIVLVPEGRPE